MKKIADQNWFSSIDNRYQDLLADQKCMSLGYYDFYVKRALGQCSLIKQQSRYNTLKILKYQESAPILIKFLIKLDLFLISKLDRFFFKIIRLIFDLPTFIIFCLVVFIVLVIFALSFPFCLVRFLNNYEPPETTTDAYFLDKEILRHPLLARREFVQVTSLSSNFLDISAVRKFSSKDFFCLLDGFSQISFKDLWAGFKLVFSLFLASPNIIIPKVIESLKSFLLLTIAHSRNHFEFKRVICVMVRPDFGVSLFCAIKKIENVFVYLSSTELTIPEKYLSEGYISCIDYAFMGSSRVICDENSYDYLFSQKNYEATFEVLDSISECHVNQKKMELSDFSSVLKTNNVEIISFFDASYGHIGVISNEAYESFKMLLKMDLTSFRKKNVKPLIIAKFKNLGNDKLLIRGFGISKDLILECKEKLSSSFDIFAVSKAVVTVPASSIIFQASQSGLPVLIYDFNGENDNLRPREHDHCIARLTKLEDVMQELKLIL